MEIDKNLTYIVVIKTDDMSYISGWIMTQWLKKQNVKLGVLPFDSFTGEINETNLQICIDSEDFRFICLDTAPKVLIDKRASHTTLFTTGVYENLPKGTRIRKWFKKDNGTLSELVWASLYGNVDDLPEWIRMHEQSCIHRDNITGDHKNLMYYLHYNNADRYEDISHIFGLFTKMSKMSLSEILEESQKQYPNASRLWAPAFAMGECYPSLRIAGESHLYEMQSKKHLLKI